MTIREATPADRDTVINLWSECGLTRPHNDPVKDFNFALEKPESTVLVLDQGGTIIASVMVGHDGHRGIVYYVSVAPQAQGRGLGRQIMTAAENWLIGRGVWKMNLLIRPGNEKVQAFYEALGYEVEPRLCMARKLV